MAPWSSNTAADEDAVSPVHGPVRKGHSEAGTLTLKRKVAVCAGLMASEAMGVFNGLNEMPLLQTLGSPVSLLTLPGAVSAAVALVLVPLQGWLGDGGSNPRHRKKPITIAAFCVGFLGMCLNLSATVLHTLQKASTGHGTNHSIRTSSSGNNITFTDRQDSQTIFHVFETLSFSRTNLTNETEFAMLVPEEDVSIMPSVLGLPLAVVLSMAGFVVMDVGFDFINTAVKTLALTHSVPADHVSLLVTGVFMSALGGCVTSVTGLLDLGSVFPIVDADPVSSQAMVQLAVLCGMGVICCASTLLSAPPSLPHPDSADDHPDDDYHYQDEDLLTVEGALSTEGGIEDSIMVSMTLHTEVQENVILATKTAAEALLSNSTQTERSFLGLSLSTTLSRSQILHPVTTEEDKVPLVQKTRQYQSIPEDTVLTIPATTTGGCLGNRKVKLCVVWLASFFSACCIFIYTVTVADYMGKVVFGGDPEADVDSETYLLYQQGMRSASLCTLILNVAYITMAVCHSKVLATISPKTEYIVVSLAMMILILAMRLTANTWIIYITAAVVGLNRAAMYTVPFVLATQLLQQAEANKPTSKLQGSEPHGGRSGFGSTMALVTTAMPSAYLVVSTIIGPLIDVTGDPSAPLLIGIVCSFLSATTVFCYKS